MAIYGPTPDASTSSKGKIMLAGDLGGTADAPSLSLNSICQGRLTLTSGTAVTTSDVTSAGTIYFTPYKGNRVALYNGSSWSLYTLTERSLALSGLTSGKPYDVFLYDNAGTLTLELLVWTNDTTRATALVMQDGILCKTGALTRRYLGTIYTTGTTTTEDSITKRYVWNYYNRVSRRMSAAETTASWVYSTATWRGSNNTSVTRLNMVIGVNEDAVLVTFQQLIAISVVGAANFAVGLDSTTAPVSYEGQLYVATAGGNNGNTVSYSLNPGIGFHYLQGLEKASVATTTWFAQAPSPGWNNLVGTVMA